MNEADIRLKLHHALQWRGYWPIHHQDGRRYVCAHGHSILVKPEVRGRPDTEARHPRFPIAFIEVKAVRGTAFPFEDISTDQRAYLTRWANEGGLSFLCLGKIMPMGTKETIESIYVIPWMPWLTAEQNARDLVDAASIPYDYGLYTNNVKVDQPSIFVRFPRYRLGKRDGSWHFPEDHPLATQPEVETPFFMRKKENSKWADAEKVPVSP